METTTYNGMVVNFTKDATVQYMIFNKVHNPFDDSCIPPDMSRGRYLSQNF